MLQYVSVLYYKELNNTHFVYSFTNWWTLELFTLFLFFFLILFLLWIMLAWIFKYRFLCEHMYLALLDMYLGVELLGRMVTNSFKNCRIPQWPNTIFHSHQNVWGFQVLHNLPSICSSPFSLNSNHPGQYLIVVWICTSIITETMMSIY